MPRSAVAEVLTDSDGAVVFSVDQPSFFLDSLAFAESVLLTLPQQQNRPASQLVNCKLAEVLQFFVRTGWTVPPVSRVHGVLACE